MNEILHDLSLTYRHWRPFDSFTTRISTKSRNGLISVIITYLTIMIIYCFESEGDWTLWCQGLRRWLSLPVVEIHRSMCDWIPPCLNEDEKWHPRHSCLAPAQWEQRGTSLFVRAHRLYTASTHGMHMHVFVNAVKNWRTEWTSISLPTLS